MSIMNVFLKRRILLVIVFIELSILTVNAQKAQINVHEMADLAGTWALNPRESSSGGNPAKDFKNYILTISVASEEIRMKKSYDFRGQHIEYELVLYADKRGETNRFPNLAENKIEKRKSKTQWKKGKLVSRFTYDIGIGRFTADVTEEYRLSKAGDKLFVDTFQENSQFPLPREALRSRRVYDRRK